MKPREEQIKLITDMLDADMIHDVMRYLGWTWRDGSTGEQRVPKPSQIRAHATNCMKRAFESEDKFFKAGGFEAEVIDGVVELRFILTRINPLSHIFEQ
jgi:hypothetical protein